MVTFVKRDVSVLKVFSMRLLVVVNLCLELPDRDFDYTCGRSALLDVVVHEPVLRNELARSFLRTISA